MRKRILATALLLISLASSDAAGQSTKRDDTVRIPDLREIVPVKMATLLGFVEGVPCLLRPDGVSKIKQVNRGLVLMEYIEPPEDTLGPLDNECPANTLYLDSLPYILELMQMEENKRARITRSFICLVSIVPTYRLLHIWS